mgnify:FL=1
MIQNNVATSDFVLRYELRPFQDKLKQENPKEIQKLKARILNKWFNFPIYLWEWHENYILDGHQRLKALNELANDGYLLDWDAVPVVFIKAKNIKEAKERVAESNSKFSTMDQEFAELWFEWCELDDLIIPDFDYLTDEEKEKEKKEDDVPDVLTTPVVKEGDTFLLWDHRIMCGDSTKAIDVAKLMWDHDADMVWTDPPYNVDMRMLPKKGSWTTKLIRITSTTS